MTDLFQYTCDDCGRTVRIDEHVSDETLARMEIERPKDGRIFPFVYSLKNPDAPIGDRVLKVSCHNCWGPAVKSSLMSAKSNFAASPGYREAMAKLTPGEMLKATENFYTDV